MRECQNPRIIKTLKMTSSNHLYSELHTHLNQQNKSVITEQEEKIFTKDVSHM